MYLRTLRFLFQPIHTEGVVDLPRSYSILIPKVFGIRLPISSFFHGLQPVLVFRDPSPAIRVAKQSVYPPSR